MEYTPQSHLPSDFDVFFGNYSKSQVGERPTLVSIDGGSLVEGGDLGAVLEIGVNLGDAFGERVVRLAVFELHGVKKFFEVADDAKAGENGLELRHEDADELFGGVLGEVNEDRLRGDRGKFGGSRSLKAVTISEFTK